MKFIESASDIGPLAASVPSTGGVYFVTAFGGLLAPYWDPGAGGLLIGLSQYTTPAHIARAVLEASAFHTRAVLVSMQADARAELKHLKVDGGMTNGDVGMQILADIGGFDVVRPEMRECVVRFSPVSGIVADDTIQVDRSRLCDSRRCSRRLRRLGPKQARDSVGGEHCGQHDIRSAACRG
jgi:glycerol kinase